ncbi:putative flagellar assembly protein FliH [Thalassobacillus devorans]|uniref:Flagellar assembly protein FliH n=1 Tax=Thalassobacillus devorans TaxID=279813 RepID=A0ABQ1P3R3_9BACI|nr:flagellar assembly protein FliH [Thalassobacillus devorans]NIK27912.1 flagellar assembly protein FliH [Thalassobacillus devorans]GGC90391.1 putative flagellar assembly protein FliH [Thalassobacillus devorans]
MSKFKSEAKSRLIRLRPVLSSEQAQNQEKQPQNLNLEAEIKRKLREAEQERNAAHEQAEDLLRNTEAEISHQKQVWEQERVHLEEAARKDGFEQGLLEGRNKGFEEFALNIEKARQVIDQAKEEYQQIIASSETDILDIAVQAAEKVICQQLTHSPESFMSLVKGVIADVQDQPEIIISVHPEQYSLLLTQKNELESLISSKSKLTIYPHAQLDSYSCLIESPFGRIDASIDSQLTELRKQLEEFNNEGNPDE